VFWWYRADRDYHNGCVNVPLFCLAVPNLRDIEISFWYKTDVGLASPNTNISTRNRKIQTDGEAEAFGSLCLCRFMESAVSVPNRQFSAAGLNFDTS